MPLDHNVNYYRYPAEYDPDMATRLGPYSDRMWKNSPRDFFFHLARHKFYSKILAGCKHVLNVGCGEGFYAGMVMQTVEKMTGIDIVPGIVEYNARNRNYGGLAEYMCWDIVQKPLERVFDGAFSSDVIEHIPHDQEDDFIKNTAASLLPYSVCLVTTPNITRKEHAGAEAELEHINLQSHDSLRELMARHFHKVLMFSMNDEMVHTGFYPMAHHLVAMAIGPRG